MQSLNPPARYVLDITQFVENAIMPSCRQLEMNMLTASMLSTPNKLGTEPLEICNCCVFWDLQNDDMLPIACSVGGWET